MLERFKVPEDIAIRVAPDYVEYILWSDRIEFAGNVKSKSPRPWPIFKFKKP